MIIQAFDKRKWPTTIGEIIDSEVAGKSAYHPQITYKYQIEGKTYTCSTDLHISGFGNKRSRLGNSQKIINEYPVGTRVKIYYDLQNPRISYLRIGPYWSDYMKLASGALLFVIGSFISLGCIYSKIQGNRNKK